MTDWLKTPAGCYLLEWERRQIEPVVADLFGFHALQLGLPELHGLAANRMPHRWLASADPVAGAAAPAPDGAPTPTGWPAVHVACEFDALPFDSGSLDLVVLPHALELARDPHLALGEVERVLRPEGRVVIIGFNPASLWGLRQGGGRLVARLLGRRDAALYLPAVGEFIAWRRLRDWLRLLSFEVEGGRFGCYRPPLRTQAWFDRFGWTEALGQRWWPVFGAVYLLVAVKRVRGMRLVGLARAQRPAAKTAPAVAVHRREAPPFD